MSARELLWGPIDLSGKPEAATEHFVVMGATGSGKSLLIKRLMQGALVPGSPHTNRAVVYDPKLEAVSTLGSLGFTEATGLRILHPFDQRAYCWDMAQDIESPIEARQLATILVPDEKGSSKGASFWTDATRDVLTAVILTFATCAPKPKSWTFRDVLLAMLYPSYLVHVLGLDEDRNGRDFVLNSRIRESYLGASEDPQKIDWQTVANLRATINSKLAIFEPIAAAWQRAYDGSAAEKRPVRRFSLTSWLASDQVLVLGNDEAARAPIDAINRALFKRMTELLLSREELSSDEKRDGRGLTWFFLDEVREAGELDGLGRLMTKGRTKGACVVLGFQDIDGMRDVYGDEVANEIVGQCSHVAVLRLSSPTTAEWAASMFGSKLADLSNSSIGKEGYQMGSSQGEVKNVYSEQILFLPVTSPKNGLHGYFKSSRIPRERMAFRQQLPWDEVLVSPAVASPLKNFEPADASVQFLSPWTVEDWRRLGFGGEPPSLPKTVLEPRQATPAETRSLLSGLRGFRPWSNG